MISWMLRWSQVRERVASDLLKIAPKATFSNGIGWIARRRVPRPLRSAIYGGFARYAGADLSALDRPIDEFECFDDFFTRPLPAGARPIAEGAGMVVSPVDGEISQIGVAESDRLIQAKGRDYTIGGLLSDPLEARAFEG